MQSIDLARHAVVLIVACALGIAGSAWAGDTKMTDAEARRFFNGAGCNACHATDETRIGPSYRAIALRYADQATAEADRLALKIRRGGAGAWGLVPMVSHPSLGQAQAQGVVRWILELHVAPKSQRTGN